MNRTLQAFLFTSLGAVAIASCSGDESTSVTATTSTTSSSSSGSSSSSSSGTAGAGGTGGSMSSSSSSSSGSTTGMGGAGQGGAGQGGAGQGGVGQGGAGQGGAGGGPLGPAALCFADDFVTPLANGPNYDQWGPTIGSHCMGTNHQTIEGVERIVFLGDSITVGTPPTLSGDFYRAQLADALAQKFGLNVPNLLWKSADPFNGTSIIRDSGDFSSCSKWGARVDDLLKDNTQIVDCCPVNQRDKRTLVIMTVGGNDIASLTKDATNNVPMADLWLKAQAFVLLMREAVAWFYEPGRFPNGVYVVFANNYEFTDGTGDVQSCDVSGLAGFDQPVPAPEQLAEIVVWVNEQYMKIATDYGADMIFLLEDFCGHGFERDNPAAPCYRGPGQQAWFDLTCIHPNPKGHDHITDMFMAVVNE